MLFIDTRTKEKVCVLELPVSSYTRVALSNATGDAWMSAYEPDDSLICVRNVSELVNANQRKRLHNLLP